MSKGLLEEIRQRVHLCDGAMGTQLAAAGLTPGSCGEAWNLDRPAVVLDIHRQYVNAGADCLLTNTFAASPLMLERMAESDRFSEINRAAVHLARQALGDGKGFVIGDIGPFGGMIEPYGEVSEQQVRDTYREQIEVLVGEGVDAIILETQAVYEEIQIGVEEARNAGAPCIITSIAFDTTRDRSEIRTMMGSSPEEAATFMDGLGVDILGVNCGSSVSIDRMANAIADYRCVCDRPTMAQPNAGSPSLVDMQVQYPHSPLDLSRGLPALLASGARIVGGCCGTTPDHIRAFRKVMDKQN